LPLATTKHSLYPERSMMHWNFCTREHHMNEKIAVPNYICQYDAGIFSSVLYILQNFLGQGLSFVQ
jgi:hypothetical protein